MSPQSACPTADTAAGRGPFNGGGHRPTPNATPAAIPRLARAELDAHPDADSDRFARGRPRPSSRRPRRRTKRPKRTPQAALTRPPPSPTDSCGRSPRSTASRAICQHTISTSACRPRPRFHASAAQPCRFGPAPRPPCARSRSRLSPHRATCARRGTPAAANPASSACERGSRSVPWSACGLDSRIARRVTRRRRRRPCSLGSLCDCRRRRGGDRRRCPG
jgi:hypothetical protein